jgi:hypothetical protein
LLLEVVVVLVVIAAMQPVHQVVEEEDLVGKIILPLCQEIRIQWLLVTEE